MLVFRLIMMISRRSVLSVFLLECVIRDWEIWMENWTVVDDVDDFFY